MATTQGRVTIWATMLPVLLPHSFTDPGDPCRFPLRCSPRFSQHPYLGPSFRAAEDLHHFWCHLTLAREMWLWRGSLVAQSLPSWKDALKEGQLRLLWLQHSSVSSVVMLKVGSDGVWLIWRRHKSGKSAVHQGEEWNLKLSHHHRKTGWRK